MWDNIEGQRETELRELCAHAPDVYCGHCKPPEEGEGLCMISDDEVQEYPYLPGEEPSFVTESWRDNGLEQVPDFFAGTPFKGESTPRNEVTEVDYDRFEQHTNIVRERVEQANNQKAAKIRMELLPFEALEDVTLAFQVGADKYARNSWRYNGVPYSVCASAMLRHFSKWQSGEEVDQRDGHPHMAAIAFYAMVILQYERDGRTELDDRYIRHNG